MRATERGFSLIELLIVISIVLIMSRIALTNMSNMMAAYALDGAARGLAAMLQRTHFNAISDTTPYRVLIYPSSSSSTPNAYKLKRATPNPPFALAAATIFVDLGGTIPMPTGATLSTSAPAINGIPTITFNSRGDVVDVSGNLIGSELYIMITNTRGATRYVWISSTSRVRIQ